MDTKYGLPEEVKFCTRCVISNQRPNSTVEHANVIEAKKQTIHFDASGVCDACRVAEEKQSICWKEREEKLRELCARHRSTDGSYDCIVPGSGGKDSFFAAHTLKFKFNMHPLSCTWRPALFTDWGFRNHTRWVDSGFDNYLVSPNGKTHRLLTRLAVENLFHPFQPFVLGQKNLAPKIAALHGINLIFYGENEAEYGNPKEESNGETRAKAFHEQSGQLYLGGESVAVLEERGLTRNDLQPYLPLEDATGIEVHYLGYYLKWHPQSCYYYAVEHGGFEPAPERTPGTYSKYNSIDDKIDDFHYWTTYQKFGIGRATYDAAQEIRSGDITRDEGLSLVHRFDGEWPGRFAAEINSYLSVPGFEPMTDKRWHELAEKFRSPHLWNGNKLRHVVA